MLFEQHLTTFLTAAPLFHRSLYIFFMRGGSLLTPILHRFSYDTADDNSSGSFERGEIEMTLVLDFVFLGAMLGFFVLSGLLVIACSKL